MSWELYYETEYREWTPSNGWGEYQTMKGKSDSKEEAELKGSDFKKKWQKNPDNSGKKIEIFIGGPYMD